MKYVDTAICLNRLQKEYDRHKKLVIGFDFDNTIFDVHNDGFECSELINLLKEAKELGFIMCLYTAETSPERLEWKKEFCKFYGFEPDYVNSSPLLEGNTVKPFFNLLLDDRAGLGQAFTLLKLIIKYANSQLIKYS